MSVQHRPLHRHEVHAVDHRVHEQHVVQPIRGERADVVVSEANLDRLPTVLPVLEVDPGGLGQAQLCVLLVLGNVHPRR
jgi:hypothetical protein